MSDACYHFQFSLFVTGRGEKQHLPKLFKSVAESRICSFIVKEFIGQLHPITSPKRLAKMVGSGKMIPDKDFEKIGAPARRYINEDQCNRVIIVDDLEEDSRPNVMDKFNRYRLALNSALQDKKDRASVHFLVNMLEAYFFAHPDAVNIALGLEPPMKEWDGDVESIRHPKSELRKYAPNYHEIDSVGQILDMLDLDVILANPNHCAALRTCIKWIVGQLLDYPKKEYLVQQNFDERFHLQTGRLLTETASQL